MNIVRPLSVAVVSVGVVACTALLGDFSVGGDPTGTGDGGGNAEGSAGEGGTVGVMPAESKIGILRSQTFTAGEAVTWSLQEGAAAGTIDDKGVYLAGSTPGTYHVVATSKADPSHSGSVPIVVVNLAISVLAGSNGGAGNIDGTTKSAHFNAPQGATGFYDNALNSRRVWVADTANHTIRYWEEKSGKVTTLAGKAGVLGSADGTGGAALFTQPTALAIDPPSKSLFVLDNKGTCIRRVHIDTGAVTTFSGTCGTPGSQNSPATYNNARTMVLALESIPGGNTPALYVCDGSLRRVELVSAATKGTTQPMLPAGEFCQYASVDGNSSSTNYVYYASNSSVKRFFPPAAYPVAAGNITTAVNGITVQYDSMAAVGSDLYFGSSYQGVIYRVLNTSNGVNLAGPTAPFLGVVDDTRTIDGTDTNLIRLGRPTGLSTFQGYDLLFGDTEGHAVRHMYPNGSGATVETQVGAAHLTDLVDGPRQSARLTGPFAVAADEAGVVYFADINFDSQLKNSTIRKYDRASAIVSSVAGLPTRPLDNTTPPVDGPKDQARFWFPIDMTYAKGKVYVVDNFAQAIRTVDVATGVVGTLAGEKTVAGNSDGVGVAAHFQFVAYASASGGVGFLSGGITTDGTNLYIADTLNYAIRKTVIATGETTTIAGGVQGTANGTGKAAQFMAPIGITYDNGFLYIADYSDQTIRRMNLANGVVDGFIGLSGQAGDLDGDASTATINFPYRIKADGLGNLYMSELPLTSQGQPSGIVRRINLKDRKISPFAGAPGAVGLQAGPIPSTLNCPTSLAIMPGHDLAFGDFCEGTLAVFQPL
jgi:hypothetical protein